LRAEFVFAQPAILVDVQFEQRLGRPLQLVGAEDPVPVAIERFDDAAWRASPDAFPRSGWWLGDDMGGEQRDDARNPAHDQCCSLHAILPIADAIGISKRMPR
jgi:hypothetical protein